MAFRIPFNEIQTAVFALLDGNVTSGSTAVPVYDFIPKSADVYPYIALGEFSGNRDGSKSSSVAECRQEIFAYSDAPGAKEVNDVLDQVVNLITTPAALTLGGGFGDIGVGAEIDFAVSKDQDDSGDVVYVGNVSFRWMITTP